MIWVIHPGSRFFYPSRITDPGVKKTPDPGSGSATRINDVYSKWETLSPVGWQAFHASRLWIRLWPNLQIKTESKIIKQKNIHRIMDQISKKTPNPKCRLFLKFTSKGTWRQVF